MKKSKLPRIDSIQELAEFWDQHDVTDFEDELEEVAKPIFVRGGGISVPLEKREAKAVEKLAKANGISAGELVRGWVLEHLPRHASLRRAQR